MLRSALTILAARLLLALAALVLTASSASARLMQAVFSGTGTIAIVSEFDELAVPERTGAFSLTYLYQTRSVGRIRGPDFDDISGQVGGLPPNPIERVVLDISGLTYDIPLTFEGAVNIHPDSFNLYFQNLSGGYGVSLRELINLRVVSLGAFPKNLDEPFRADVSAVAQWYVEDLGPYLFDEERYVVYRLGGAVLNVTHVDVSAVVPEPTTWALLIIGFGAIGTLMRRHRQTFFR